MSQNNIVIKKNDLTAFTVYQKQNHSATTKSRSQRLARFLDSNTQRLTAICGKKAYYIEYLLEIQIFGFNQIDILV